MTEESNLGVGAEQPAAPSEQAQVTDSASVEQAANSLSPAEQITENVVASEPVSADETEWIEGKEFGDDETRVPYDRQLGRKYFMQVQQMGGAAVFDAAREIASGLVSSEPDVVSLANTIHSLNPDAYQRLGSVLIKASLKKNPDEFLPAVFGEGVTAERIIQALNGTPVETYDWQQEPDEPTDQTLSPEIEAKLKKLDELEKKFPELETKVGKYDEIEQARQQEKIETFGQEIVTEAMSPLGKLFEDAGLKILPDDTPEEIAAKQEIAETVYERTYNKVYRDPNNKAFVDETEAGIKSLNTLVAKKHMLKLQARIEREAARQLQIFTGKRAQVRNLQTKPLNKETPKTIPGQQSGAAAFAQTTDTTPPFDESRGVQVFQDIMQRQ